MKEYDVKKAMEYIQRREFLTQSVKKLNEALRDHSTIVEVFGENSIGETYSRVKFEDKDIVRALLSAIEAELKEIAENLKNLGVEE